MQRTTALAPIRWGFRVCFTIIFSAFVVPAFANDSKGDTNESGNGTGASSSDAVPKFELDIMPLLTADGCNAGACHGKARGQNGFALSLLGFDHDFDYSALVHEGRGRRLFPAVPSLSLVLQKASGQLPHGGGIRWPVEGPEYELVTRWVVAGMPRVSEADPQLLRIELHPEPHPLAVRSEETIQVFAHYSDGSVRDVTQTSAFMSNEPAIVAVNDQGNLRAGDLPGEATIMARYMGHISTWSTAIPRPEIPSPDVYTALPVNNFIDRLVWDKLQSLNLLPSEGIDDAKFIRRVSLDLIGRLPTPDEVNQFLENPATNRREQLVDQLLQRPEYADFWANKWVDLIRPNPYRVGIKATLTLDQWLREKFRDNTPMDQFARELVTAKGSTWRNGATTVFRDRRTPEEMTTMLCQLLLGVRLECAKCHQHPFEVFGQREFYGMAAYFARVGYKGTGLSPPISGGEEIVMSIDKGDVRHPLTGEILKPSPLYGGDEMVDETIDRRAAFADWLTNVDNDRFAEAAVNRLWGELFTVGIVDPVDDLRATNPPSNPELLRALAEEYRRVGFDQKAMLKTMVMSHAYSLSSLPNESNAGDNRNYSRHYRRLMRAEVLADAISDVTGVQDQFAAMPPGSRAMETWTNRIDSEFLDAFGRPDANQDPPCERLPQATMVQALHMMNAGAIQKKLADANSIVAQLAKDEVSAADAIDQIYLRVYSRLPTPEHRQQLLDLLASTSDRKLFFEDLMWSLLNTPEFLYED